MNTLQQLDARIPEVLLLDMSVPLLRRIHLLLLLLQCLSLLLWKKEQQQQQEEAALSSFLLQKGRLLHPEKSVHLCVLLLLLQQRVEWQRAVVRLLLQSDVLQGEVWNLADMLQQQRAMLRYTVQHLMGIYFLNMLLLLLLLPSV